ncbi:hypothetical protein QTH89_14490 [Variovorax sp. J22G21]|nr:MULTISPECIES: hypothetical protein [unclassified Variovorax]MDM0037631.1 hypothetical protein [Variovorax sp. J22R193]MDM0062407.1 hypothetical protein [Variovorax sp. J22G21]
MDTIVVDTGVKLRRDHRPLTLLQAKLHEFYLQDVAARDRSEEGREAGS